MRKSKFTIYADNTQRKFNDFYLFQQKIKKTQDSSLLNHVNLTETCDNNKDYKLHQKLKNNILQNTQENGLKRSVNKENYEQKIKFNKSRVPSQEIIRNATEDFNKLDSNYYQSNNQRFININIQNMNNYHYFSKIKKLNVFNEKFPKISSIINQNLDLNNIKITNNNDNNHNNLNNNVNILHTNNNINMNVFINKLKKVRLGDIKKIKFHQKSNNIVNSERLDIKSIRFFNKIEQNNNRTIVKKDKEGIKSHKKINIIENNDDSFIEEINDLLLNVDNKGKLQVKREIVKNELIEKKQLITEENRFETKNNYGVLLNKNFEIYKDEKNEENKEGEIKIRNIFINKRPPTSYGGIKDREKSIKNSIREKIKKKNKKSFI